MSYAIGVLGTVCLANLLLILALVRQVRRQDAQLASHTRLRPLPALRAGAMAPDFTVTTVTGDTRTRSDLGGERGVVAFITADCDACRARIPDLKDYARAHPSGLTHVVAVICGPPNREAEQLASELQDCMSVTIEPVNGPVQQAYSVTDYPVFYVTRPDGRITARGTYLEAFEGPHLRLTV